MRRIFILMVVLLNLQIARGQLYTGGQGDGATMSCVPPKVTTLGKTEFICVGDTITLQIAATGSDLQYFWQKFEDNFYVNLEEQPYYAGLGTPVLKIILPDKIRDDGRYRCLVKNTCDSDTSEVFVLNLNFPPEIKFRLSLSESMQFACANQTDHVDLISSIISPKNDHRYSWMKIDTASGARNYLTDTTSTLKVKLSGAALDAGGLYVVSAYNECGMVTDSVNLPVYRAPEIIWQNVVNKRIATCEGEKLELSAVVTGGGSYSYSLEKVAFDEFTQEWRVISSIPVNAPSRMYNAVTLWDEGYYRWRVYNQCAEDGVTSEIIYMSVEGRPSFKFPVNEVYQFPTDTVVCEGSTLELMCKASGSATRYYWLKNGERVPGVDTNVLVLTDVTEADAAKYVCVAYNSCMTTVKSRAIKVSLHLRPRFMRDPYLLKKACVGDTLTYFRVATEIDPEVDSVRWMYNGSLIYDNGHYENTGTKDLLLHHISDKDVGLYQVRAYNKCGATDSKWVNLFELGIPVSFQSNLDDYKVLLCPGMEQKLAVSVNGSAPIHYKWILNEHSYETDTCYVTVKGQDITEKNKFTVFAYNACGSAIDSGFLKVERFDHFKFVGEGEYCASEDPVSHLELQGSDPDLTYTLYREYGTKIETLKGTGDTLKFENQPGGTYYMIAENPKTECRQEMDGRPVIVEKPSPSKAQFYISSYYCMGTRGATLVLAKWENGVKYQLQRNNGAGFRDVANSWFIGGVRDFPLQSQNSPNDGEPKIYPDMGAGAYRIVAESFLNGNGCRTILTLEDSIQILEPPSRHELFAVNGDTVNCNRIVNGEPYAEKAALEVDRFIKGATYTLYKNGIPDPDHEPDRTSPVGWALLDEGVYHVLVETREGCTGTTNSVRIRNVQAPAYQTLSGSGSLCADEDTETDYKTLTLNGTEQGVTYYVYRKEPYKFIDTLVGTGLPRDLIVPAQRATYYVKAVDETGMCPTTFDSEFTMLASDFQVSTNPADIFLDKKGQTTWLHVDITGSYVQPLSVEWQDESQLQQSGIVSLPNTQYYKHYHWPFCPCADYHGNWGDISYHRYYHGPHCTMLNCPYLYHNYNPKANGCIYLGTEYQNYDYNGYARRGPWYDLYSCPDGGNQSSSQNWYENDANNPFRNRLTLPVNEDRIYTVTVTDGAGCTHEDQVAVRILGGKLRANILYSVLHKHYAYPFCPCAYQHGHTHYCSPSCNENNCIRLYHAHKHEGCTFIKSEYIEYMGAIQKYYDMYYCCTDNEARDTAVFRKDELFFCSSAEGGDYNYVKKWSFYCPEDNSASWTGMTGDTVKFTALESGWLYLQVTSMGQEVRDSIWIDVLRRPFAAEIQDGEGNRVDTLYLCKGEDARLYAHTTEGDDPTTMVQWWGEGYDGPNKPWWLFRPEKSGNIILTARNDGVVVRDTAYIYLQEKPEKPVINRTGVRCVQSAQTEIIRVENPTVAGANYILEYSIDGGVTFAEYDRENNSAGGAIEFRITMPVTNAGIYRVRVDGKAGDHVCDVFSDPIELIAPPAHDELEPLEYCEGSQLTVQLKKPTAGMSYSLLSDRGICFETIKTPMDFFKKPIGAGNYKIAYIRTGIYGNCADTVPITVEKIPYAQLVDVVVNDGAPACEGMNAVLAIPNTEPLVNYYLESPAGVKTELFIGDGSFMSKNISGRPYGTYQVIGEYKGCTTLIDYFTFNRNPKEVVQPDVYYCFPYATNENSSSMELKYTTLENGVTYSLVREGTELQTLHGPGAGTFTKVTSGRYSIVAKNDESGCISETSFEVSAEQAPYAFKLEMNCAREKTITLEHSEPDILYTLYRDATILDSLYGNGEALEFGIFDSTGIYTAVGIDTATGCQTNMDGSLIINQVGKCELEQESPICNRFGSTEILYPCSKKGWTYYIKDITDYTNVKYSTPKDGDGSMLRWSSMGTTTDLFGPHWINKKQWIPSVYVLCGKDVCGDIALDTIEISLNTPPPGTLEMGGLVASTEGDAPLTQKYTACPNEQLEFFVSDIPENIECVFIGVLSTNFQDTLKQFVAEAKHMQHTSIGIYSGYKSYVLYLNDGGCQTKLSYQIDFRTMPELGFMKGKGVCENQGTLDIKLQGQITNQNYYLMREGFDTPLDTILYDESRLAFKPQTENGRYYVIAENVYPAGTGKYIGICKDTMPNTYAIGPSPTRFHVSSYLDGEQEIFLCVGNTEKITLANTESTVDYILVKDGVETGDWQHRKNGGSLEFEVTESGIYFVKGVLGDCEEKMIDSVVVYADEIPELKLYDNYYYCREVEGGAVIEIVDAPMECVVELRNAGVDGLVIEADTVHYFGDTIRFNTICPAGDYYNLTITTRGGCRLNHPFSVHRMDPPQEFKVLATANAICEGECTTVGVMGDEPRIEYSLVRVDVNGDFEYNDNFILGEGERDTIWFPYPICDVGEYYVVATQYDRPYCSTIMKLPPNDTLTLQAIDTIRYCEFADYDLHYCAADASGPTGFGASITLLNAQLGIEYYLFKRDVNLGEVGHDRMKRASFEGENLVWNNVLSDTLCTGDWDVSTPYRVLALNPLTGCTKWMKGIVNVTGDDYIDQVAMTQPYYEFCDGGNLLLKVRNSGCGLNYQWIRVNPTGAVTVGNEADLYLDSLVSADQGSYYCEVSNACGVMETQPRIVVNVKSEGYIVKRMGTQTVCQGGNAVLYSMMNEVNNYAWYKKGDGRILSRESFLILENITPDMAGNYICAGGSLENGDCNVVYDTLFVEVALNVDSVNIVPKFDTICTGSNLMLTIRDQVPVGYNAQWYLNGAAILGQIGYSYQLTPAYTKHAGLYSVQLTSGCGKRDLIPVATVVVDSVIDYVWHTEDKYLCQPINVALSIRTTPMSGVKYDWYQLVDGSGEQFVERGSDILTSFPEGATHVTYRVYYHNSCPANYFSTLNYKDVEVNLARNIEITRDLPSEITGCQGDMVDTTLKVAVSGTTVYDYVWTFTPASTTQVDTVASGAGQDTYTVPYDREHSGVYTCTMLTDCGRLVSHACWVRVNTPAEITEDLTAVAGKMCEGSYYTPTIRATGSDLQFRWVITYPDGTADTVRKAIGYDWDATDQLELMTDVKYDGAELQCIVWNNCGTDASTPITLQIVPPKEITVKPAETWLCCDSTAQVEIELVNGDGGSWSYKLQRNDNNPAPYTVAAGEVKDTADGLISGTYVIKEFSDGICDYKDKIMKEFYVYDVPRATVEFALQTGKRDTTVCAGSKVPLFIKISNGTGPYKVEVYYKDATMSEPALYNKWLDMNPFILTKTEAAVGDKFDMIVADNLELTVVVTDMSEALVKGGCLVPVGADQVVRVKSVNKLNVNWAGWSQTVGECELDIDLRTVLNPSPTNGVFHITKYHKGKAEADTTFDREWAVANILKSDGPGIYEIGYSLGGVCDEKAGSNLTLTVDSLPYAVITPQDTTLCCGGGSPQLQVFLRGAEPMDSLYVETSRLKRNGTVTSGNTYYTLANKFPLRNPQPLPYSMMADCSDSIARYVVLDLKDDHGCHMKPGVQPQALVRVHKLPEISVEGLHPAYNNGMWDLYNQYYNLKQGDSVKFRVTLQSGETPWKLDLAYLTSAPPAVPAERPVYTVYGRDTIVTLKKDGWYVFDCSEVNGCSQVGGDVVREIHFAPPGYIQITGLYLGGPLAHLVGTSYKPMNQVRMQSDLPNLMDFPDYGYDPVGFAHAMASDKPVIDWIFVEARKLDDKGKWIKVDRDTCLLLSDGRVVNRDFNTALKFEGTGTVGEKFYVAVFHRNHLPVMTVNPQEFGPVSPTFIKFGLSPNNYYVREGVITDHVWDFWGNGLLWVMAPSYRQINKVAELVSMSNTTEAYFKNLLPTYNNQGYWIWDVTFDGLVNNPPINGVDRTTDAWILFLNRDRYSEIEE